MIAMLNRDGLINIDVAGEVAPKTVAAGTATPNLNVQIRSSSRLGCLNFSYNIFDYKSYSVGGDQTPPVVFPVRIGMQLCANTYQSIHDVWVSIEYVFKVS